MDFSTMPLPRSIAGRTGTMQLLWQLPSEGIRPTYPGFPVEVVAFTG
jgi:hypothetical protein